jgi:hypothetical protein
MHHTAVYKPIIIHTRCEYMQVHACIEELRWRTHFALNNSSKCFRGKASFRADYKVGLFDTEQYIRAVTRDVNRKKTRESSNKLAERQIDNNCLLQPSYQYQYLYFREYAAMFELSIDHLIFKVCFVYVLCHALQHVLLSVEKVYCKYFLYLQRISWSHKHVLIVG